MAWRVHIGDRPIYQCDILPGKPSVLAVWTTPNTILHLDLQTGAKRGDTTITPPTTADRTSDAWKTYIAGLKAPNDVLLPSVRLSKPDVLHIETATDGSMRLYRTNKGSLSLALNDQETPLTLETAAGENMFAIAADIDRTLGLIAALDNSGRLHLFQQQVRVGVFETGLKITPDVRVDLAVSDGGGTIFTSDGRQVVTVTTTGQVCRRLDLYYTMGRMCPSPDGRMLAISDMDAGVIRLYDAESLKLTHQRFAVDLIADAKRVQLNPGPTTPSGAVGALTLNKRGVLAFSMAGTVCVTTLAKLKPLPGIKPIKVNRDDPPPDAISAANERSLPS